MCDVIAVLMPAASLACRTAINRQTAVAATTDARMPPPPAFGFVLALTAWSTWWYHWQDRLRIWYTDLCDANNLTALARYVEKGYISIASPAAGLSIEDGASITITVWDADLNSDPLSTQVPLLRLAYHCTAFALEVAVAGRGVWALERLLTGKCWWGLCSRLADSCASMQRRAAIPKC